ncbi:MAG: hypothetical protein JOZ62_04610, partial [Acidobacteriaceae bacterium]|nr:hypothetical protein [Acidobacteriaceae bacterium]
MKRLLLATLSLLTVSCSRAPTFNVKDFGAKGDGVSDDYDAMQAAATALCKSPGATLVFPKGVYRINRHRITGGPKPNVVQNIRYLGCNGVTILGNGSKVDVKGKFRRTADYSEGTNTFSYSTGVIPFEMINSSRFRIQGFELAGNVDQMSRDANVVEGSNAGILTTNCKDYSIENVTVHDFSTDGITLGGNSTLADQRVHLKNVTSTGNARNGLSVIQVRDGMIV